MRASKALDQPVNASPVDYPCSRNPIFSMDQSPLNMPRIFQWPAETSRGSFNRAANHNVSHWKNIRGRFLGLPWFARFRKPSSKLVWRCGSWFWVSEGRDIDSRPEILGSPVAEGKGCFTIAKALAQDCCVLRSQEPKQVICFRYQPSLGMVIHLFDKFIDHHTCDEWIRNKSQQIISWIV